MWNTSASKRKADLGTKSSVKFTIVCDTDITLRESPAIGARKTGLSKAEIEVVVSCINIVSFCYFLLIRLYIWLCKVMHSFFFSVIILPTFSLFNLNRRPFWKPLCDPLWPFKSEIFQNISKWYWFTIEPFKNVAYSLQFALRCRTLFPTIFFLLFLQRC